MHYFYCCQVHFKEKSRRLKPAAQNRREKPFRLLILRHRNSKMEILYFIYESNSIMMAELAGTRAIPS